MDDKLMIQRDLADRWLLSVRGGLSEGVRPASLASWRGENCVVGGSPSGRLVRWWGWRGCYRGEGAAPLCGSGLWSAGVSPA